MSDREVRAFRLPIELRADDGNEGGLPSIRGHAAVFNQRSEDLGGWFEVILPGAFDESLARGDDVRALVDHDPSKILGREKANTLSLDVDEKGLQVKIDPPNTTVARDIIENIRTGNVDSMSFAFTVDEDGQRLVFPDDGTIVREVFNVSRLFDVSPVSYPAYVDTDVAVRSMIGYQQAHKDIDSRVAEMLAKAEKRDTRRVNIQRPKQADEEMERMQQVTDDMKKKHNIA